MSIARRLYEALTPRRFERFWAEFWARGGWDVTLTPYTNDGGFDFEVKHPETGATYRMDVKRHHAPLWEEDVSQLYEKYQRQNTDSQIPLAFLTTGGYTERATQYATRENLTIKSRNYIERVVSPSSPLYQAATNGLPLYPEDKAELRRRLLMSHKTASADALGYMHSHSATHRLLHKLETETTGDTVDVSTVRYFDPRRAAESLPTRAYPVKQLRNH